MSKTDSVSTLLREQAGKGKFDIIKGGVTQASTDYCRVEFPIATTLNQLDAANIVNGTTADLLGIALPAGTILRMRITRISVTTGLAICYTETDGDITA